MQRTWTAGLALMMACEGGSGGGSGAAAELQRAIDQLCSKAYDCMESFPPDAGFAFAEVFQSSEDECVTFFRALSNVDETEASIEAGRIEYDAGDADVCNDAQAALTCDQFWGNFTGENPVPAPPECQTAFVGTVPPGGACTIDQDCAGDGFVCSDAMVCE